MVGRVDVDVTAGLIGQSESESVNGGGDAEDGYEDGCEETHLCFG